MELIEAGRVTYDSSRIVHEFASIEQIAGRDRLIAARSADEPGRLQPEFAGV
jgi:hypothetical protein